MVVCIYILLPKLKTPYLIICQISAEPYQCARAHHIIYSFIQYFYKHCSAVYFVKYKICKKGKCPFIQKCWQTHTNNNSEKICSYIIRTHIRKSESKIHHHNSIHTQMPCYKYIHKHSGNSGKNGCLYWLGIHTITHNKHQ